MKKIILTLALIIVASAASWAQKFALVDMEYIFSNVPAYEMANEQLNQLSMRWQKEIENVSKQAETMYNSYLADKVFLTEEQVKKREEAIVAKEKEATELRYKYFGPDGELAIKRQRGACQIRLFQLILLFLQNHQNSKNYVYNKPCLKKSF